MEAWADLYSTTLTVEVASLPKGVAKGAQWVALLRLAARNIPESAPLSNFSQKRHFCAGSQGISLSV